MSTLRPLPVATPETAHFWEGTRQGELRLQRCGPCAFTYFPPQPFCPQCSGSDVEIVAASGTGTVLSYVVSHRAAPGFTAPYVIAVVELAEGPRLLTNLVDVLVDIEIDIEIDVDAIAAHDAFRWLDLVVEVVFEYVDDVALPLFRPRRET